MTANSVVDSDAANTGCSGDVVKANEESMFMLLMETLATIEAEAPNFNQSFELVDQLVNELGEEQLAIRLYEQIPDIIPWKVVGDLFGILVWSTSDNGAALCRTLEAWLEAGEDVRKIRISLVNDVYPFKSRERMNQVLTRIAVKYPEVAETCQQLISKRSKILE